MSYMTFKSTWVYNREYPIGSEQAIGNKDLVVNLDKFQPFIDLIEQEP